MCAGLAAASGLDVTLVRLAFVLAGLGGFGIIAYLVLMFVVPKEDPAKGDFLLPAPPNVAQWIRVALGIGRRVGAISLVDSGPRFMGRRDGFGFGLGLLLLVVGARDLGTPGPLTVRRRPMSPLPGRTARRRSQPGRPRNAGRVGDAGMAPSGRSDGGTRRHRSRWPSWRGAAARAGLDSDAAIP